MERSQSTSRMIKRSHFCNNSEHCSMSRFFSIFANVSILWNTKNLLMTRKMTTLRIGRSCRWLQRSSLKITDSRSYKQFKYCSTHFLPNNSNSQYLFRRTFRTWCQIAPTWWVWHFFIVQLMGRSEISRKSLYRKAWHCPINLQRKYSHLLYQWDWKCLIGFVFEGFSK